MITGLINLPSTGPRMHLIDGFEYISSSSIHSKYTVETIPKCTQEFCRFHYPRYNCLHTLCGAINL